MGDHASSIAYPKGVRLMTMQDIPTLWDQVAKTHSLFFEPTENDRARFAELMAHPTTYGFIVDEGALVFLYDVEPGNSASYAGVIWEKELYGSAPRAKELLVWLFKLLGLRRMSAEVPADNHLGRAYTESLGFRQEGRRREALRRGDKTADLMIYGLLKSEVENGLGSGSTVRGGRSRGAGFEYEQRERGQAESSLRGDQAGTESRVGSARGGHPRSTAPVNSWYTRLLGALGWKRNQPRRPRDAGGNGGDGNTVGHQPPSYSD